MNAAHLEAATSKEKLVNINSTRPARHRIAAALLAGAGAVAAVGIGTAAPAGATFDGKFVAISYSPESNAWGVWTDAPTKEGAHIGALKMCQDNGGSHCLVAAWAQNACVALAVDPADQWRWAAAHGATEMSARHSALVMNPAGNIRKSSC